MTTDQVNKVENLLTKTNYSGTITTSGSGIIATIPIPESSNVFLEVNINAHAYNGMITFGTIQAQYQRISVKAAKEITQSLVGVWSVYPQSNLWNPRLELSQNTVSVLLTPDSTYSITYDVNISLETVSLASDGYAPIITNESLIALATSVGGFGFDAEHITEDVSKPRYVSSVTNLVGNSITITRHSTSSYDPEISETTEGYPCLKWSGNQGLDIGSCPTNSANHSLFIVMKPVISNNNGTIFESENLLFTQCFPVLSCPGPGLFGAGSAKSISQESGLQILEFKANSVENVSKVYRDGVEIGTAIYSGTTNLIANSTFGYSANGWYLLGQVLEVWEFETNLSTEQRAQVYEYLQYKFPETIP